MKTIPSLAIVAAITFFPLSSTFAQGIWTSGHGDISVAYGIDGLEGEWHLGEDNEEVVVDGITLQSPDGFEYETDAITATLPFDRSFLRPAGVDWNFLGANAGESVWVFPATSIEAVGIPYLGFGTEELNPADWSSDITFTLTSAMGSGVDDGGFFSLYTTDEFGVPTAFATTFGGVSGFIAQAAGDHTHYNVAFTQTGVYEVTFTISGTHVTDGFQSTSATYTFNIIPEPTSLMLIGVGASALLLRRRRHGRVL